MNLEESRIGELTFLGLDQIRFSYQIISKDNLLAGSKLFIERQEGKIACDNCEYEGQVSYKENDSFHLHLPQFSCPQCGGMVKILKGKECLIKHIKVVT